MTNEQSRTSRIRELNDQFRQEMPHGRVIVTHGVSKFSNDQLGEITQAIRSFDAFESNEDLLDEHDADTLEYEGVKLCWMIDACGEYRAFKFPAPTDKTVTRRFLVIMLGGEARALVIGMQLTPWVPQAHEGAQA